jgi:integrase
MPLTVVEVRNAKPGEKPYKVADEKGLYLFVTPKGVKSWRLKYRYGGKEKVLTFGQFPEVALAEARERREAARATLRLNKDPAVEAERDRRAAVAAAGAAFKVSALAWHEDERPRWSADYAQVVMNALDRDVFPDLGRMPISEIDGPLILRALRKIERRGSIETAKRVLGYIHSIFVRAKGEHLVSADPTVDLVRALKPTPKGAKQPAITTLPGLIEMQRVVDRATSSPTTKLASRLLALTAVRIGVLRTALWSEFEGIDWADPDQTPAAATWRIPAERMKLDVEEKGDEAFDHDVPLTPQMIDALRALHRLTGRGKLLFPGGKSAREPMSDAALSTLYKRMADGRYKGRHVPHGWRAAFSTLMNEWAMEHGKEGDRLLIDLMLAHRPKGMSGSEFAYNRARFSARRRVLADAWSAMITEGLEHPDALLRNQEAR